MFKGHDLQFQCCIEETERVKHVCYLGRAGASRRSSEEEEEEEWTTEDRKDRFIYLFIFFYLTFFKEPSQDLSLEHTHKSQAFTFQKRW